MLTGDALLTSLHVAKQVGICSSSDSTNNSVDSGSTTATAAGGGGSNCLRLPLTLVGVEAGVVCPLPVYSAGNNTATVSGSITGSYWSIRTPDGHHYALPLHPTYASLARLDEHYDLLTTEHDFLIATEASGGEAR